MFNVQRSTSEIQVISVCMIWSVIYVDCNRVSFIVVSLYLKVWFSFQILANLTRKTHKSASNLMQIEQIFSHSQNILKLYFWSYRDMRNLCRFLEFVESLIKISDKSSNCKINLTVSLFSVLYVVYSMLYM